MAEFEVAWAPLSRKWQVWHRQANRSGCSIETLIGEYSSEGRARHQISVLKGESSADTEFETPVKRRLFFLPTRKKRDVAESVDPSESTHDSKTTAVKDASAQPEGSKSTTATRRSTRNTAAASPEPEWHREVTAVLQGAMSHAAEKNSTEVRRLLNQALRICPGGRARTTAS